MRRDIYTVQIMRRRRSSPSAVEPGAGQVSYETLKEFLSNKYGTIRNFTRGYTALDGYYPNVVAPGGVNIKLTYSSFDIAVFQSSLVTLKRVTFDNAFLYMCSPHYQIKPDTVLTVLDPSTVYDGYKYVGDKISGNVPEVSSIDWTYSIEGNVAYLRNFEYGSPVSAADLRVPYYPLVFNPHYYNYSNPSAAQAIESACNATVNGNTAFNFTKSAGYPAGGMRPTDYTMSLGTNFDEKLRTDFSTNTRTFPDSLVIEFI